MRAQASRAELSWGLGTNCAGAMIQWSVGFAACACLGGCILMAHLFGPVRYLPQRALLWSLAGLAATSSF